MLRVKSSGFCGYGWTPWWASLLNMNIEVGTVILSVAKNLCVASEILRYAQNDRSIPILVVNVHRYQLTYDVNLNDCSIGWKYWVLAASKVACSVA